MLGLGLTAFGSDNNSEARNQATEACSSYSDDARVYHSCIENLTKKFSGNQSQTTSGNGNQQTASDTAQQSSAQSQEATGDSAKIAEVKAQISQLSEEESECVKETESATKYCDLNSNQETKAASQFANQMLGGLKTAVGSSTAALCGKMGEASQKLDLALTAYRGLCTYNWTQCSNVCKTELEDLKRKKETLQSITPANEALTLKLNDQLKLVSSAQTRCGKLVSNMNQALTGVGSYVAMENAKSQYCTQQADALAAFCKSQPNNVVCGQANSSDCTNPSVASTSLVCICKANKNDSRCTSSLYANGSLSSQSLSSKSGSGGSGSESDLAKSGDFGGIGDGAGGLGDNINPGAGGGEGGGLPRGGAQGGRAGLDVGGGGSGGGGGAPSGGGRDPLNTKTILGYGIGGGGAAGSRGSSSSSSGSYYASGAGGGKQGSIDLRKYLPGGKFDATRALAGISGPDGITGPNTDIWKKVNQRYFNITPSLLP